MNEQDVLLRVGELAGQVGYPMPSVSQVECKEGEECVWLRPNNQGGMTLALHEGFQDRFPAAVLDFLIAQELVQARHGLFGRLRRLKLAQTVWGFLIAIAAVPIGGQLIETLWLAIPVSLAVAYLVLTVINVLATTLFLRWTISRADRELVEVLGRPHVVEALEWYAATDPRRFGFRWVLRGAPPVARKRLRRLRP